MEEVKTTNSVDKKPEVKPSDVTRNSDGFKPVRKFGFGKPLGIDLQGEEAGIVKERKNETRGISHGF